MFQPYYYFKDNSVCMYVCVEHTDFSRYISVTLAIYVCMFVCKFWATFWYIQNGHNIITTLVLPLTFVHHLYRDHKELYWVDIFPLKCDNRPNIYTHIYEANHGKCLVVSQISHLDWKAHLLSPWLNHFTVLSATAPVPAITHLSGKQVWAL